MHSQSSTKATKLQQYIQHRKTIGGGTVYRKCKKNTSQKLKNFDDIIEK